MKIGTFRFDDLCNWLGIGGAIVEEVDVDRSPWSGVPADHVVQAAPRRLILALRL